MKKPNVHIQKVTLDDLSREWLGENLAEALSQVGVIEDYDRVPYFFIKVEKGRVKLVVNAPTKKVGVALGAIITVLGGPSLFSIFRQLLGG